MIVFTIQSNCFFVSSLLTIRKNTPIYVKNLNNSERVILGQILKVNNLFETTEGIKFSYKYAVLGEIILIKLTGKGISCKTRRTNNDRIGIKRPVLRK